MDAFHSRSADRVVDSKVGVVRDEVSCSAPFTYFFKSSSYSTRYYNHTAYQRTQLTNPNPKHPLSRSIAHALTPVARGLRRKPARDLASLRSQSWQTLRFATKLVRMRCMLTKISTQEQQELLVGKCLRKVRVPIAFNSFDHCVRYLFCISNRMVNRSGRNERMIRYICLYNNSFYKTWSSGFCTFLVFNSIDSTKSYKS